MLVSPKISRGPGGFREVLEADRKKFFQILNKGLCGRSSYDFKLPVDGLGVLGRSWGLCWRSWAALGAFVGGLGPLLAEMEQGCGPARRNPIGIFLWIIYLSNRVYLHLTGSFELYFFSGKASGLCFLGF